MGLSPDERAMVRMINQRLERESPEQWQGNVVMIVMKDGRIKMGRDR